MAQTVRPRYRLAEGGLQHRFQLSRAKIQVFGGGFGNGKTTSAVMKALQLAQAYPGSNGLIARATYPKLKDTIQKEFMKWCPSKWIERAPTDKENTLRLTNGTQVNFRYIAQRGKNSEHQSSNLLSASFDWIIVDQMEDPEITEKDFDDLMGRLRGQTRLHPAYVDGYGGPPMPATGPRWMILTMNPTSGWPFRRLVRPLQRYARGIMDENLIVHPDTGAPWIELFEGSTYENADNLPEDFIKGLEATYTGQMRDRFLLGKWASYEGLVYPPFNADVHMVDAYAMDEYINRMMQRYTPSWIEGYDFGIAVPSCYLLSFVDPMGNILVRDGFHVGEIDVYPQANLIKEIRRKHKVRPDKAVRADPSIFRRGPQAEGKKAVGKSVSKMFKEKAVVMERGNNAILNGIVKVGSYLKPQKFHQNPFTGETIAPYMYFCSELDFIEEEITEYRWKQNPYGDFIDQPIDRNDHAMDTLKYMLGKQPDITKITINRRTRRPAYMTWGEFERQREDTRMKVRHAA